MIYLTMFSIGGNIMKKYEEELVSIAYRMLPSKSDEEDAQAIGWNNAIDASVHIVAKFLAKLIYE